MCTAETRTPPNPTTTNASNQRTNTASGGCPACTITSQTIAVSPANRARTRIGVGEEVTLTVAPGPATWVITSGSGTLGPSNGSHTSVTFTAGDTAGNVTITATGAGCSCTITFTVVEPSHWTMKRDMSKNLKHTHNRPDCGWMASALYVHPNDVNFYRIEDREIDSRAVANGSYSAFNNIVHGHYPGPTFASGWFPMTGHSDADGTTDGAPDQIYSGDTGSRATGTAPPFTVGKMYFPITIQWRVVGSSAVHDFPIVRQEHEIFANGRCESRKGGHQEHTMYSDPTSTF